MESLPYKSAFVSVWLLGVEKFAVSFVIPCLDIAKFEANLFIIATCCFGAVELAASMGRFGLITGMQSTGMNCLAAYEVLWTSVFVGMLALSSQL